MTQLLVWWAVLAASIWVVSRLLDGFEVKGATGAMVVGGVFGVLNWLLAKLLFGVGVVALLWLPLALPALSFVLHWLITTLLLWITHKLTDQLEIKSFGVALVAALILTVLGTVAQGVLVVMF
jgi:uncharacterized membrane protein YvlD (DUF360 family)